MMKFAAGLYCVFVMGCAIGMCAELIWPLRSRQVIHQDHYITAVVAGSATPTTPRQSFDAEIEITTPHAKRVHVVHLAEGGCAAVTEKTDQFDDDFKLCVVADGGTVRIENAGTTTARGGTAGERQEYQTRSESRMSRTGGVMTSGRSDGVRITVRVRPAA